MRLRVPATDGTLTSYFTRSLIGHLEDLSLGLAYLQYRLLHEPSPRIKSLADVIRLHRDEHTRHWLTGACQEAIATGDLEAVLNRFLRLDD